MHINYSPVLMEISIALWIIVLIELGHLLIKIFA